VSWEWYNCLLIFKEESSSVKKVKIIFTFAFSITFFIVSYFSYTTLGDGFAWVFYLIAGIILAIIGVIIALSNRNN
jgi:hypothetical protein